MNIKNQLKVLTAFIAICACTTEIQAARPLRTIAMNVTGVSNPNTQRQIIADQIFNLQPTRPTKSGKTQTVFGEMLASQINTSSPQYQAAIEELATNPKLRTAIQRELATINAIQAQLLGYWRPLDIEERKAERKVYYKGPFGRMNQNEASLALSNHGSTVGSTTFVALISSSLVNTAGFGVVFFGWNPWILVGVFGVGVTATLRTAFVQRKRYTIINQIQQRVSSFAELCRSYDRLQKILDGTAIGLALESQHVQATRAHDKKFTKLRKTLYSRVFKRKAYSWYRTGRVLATHKQLEKQKESFTDMFKFIGELDACVSTAQYQYATTTA